MWVFLTKNKCPPIHLIDCFLQTYGLQDDTVKIARTGQGGELARSTIFCKTVAQCGYQVEITGTDNSSQNSKMERPHQTLAAMMQSCLENAGLHKKYWSDALLHSVFVKKKAYHTLHLNLNLRHILLWLVSNQIFLTLRYWLSNNCSTTRLTPWQSQFISLF